MGSVTDDFGRGAARITHDEASEAMRLVNDAGSYPDLIRLAPSIPAELRAALEAAHDTAGCVAHGEGLNCCIDILLDDDLARFDPAKVEAASELLSRYRAEWYGEQFR